MTVLKSEVQFYIDSRWSNLTRELSGRKLIYTSRLFQNYDGYFEGRDGTGTGAAALVGADLNIENGLTYMVLYDRSRTFTSPPLADLMYFRDTTAGETFEFNAVTANLYVAKAGAGAGAYTASISPDNKQCVGFSWKPAEVCRMYADGVFASTSTAIPWNSTKLNDLYPIFTWALVDYKIKAVVVINRKCTDAEMVEIQESLEKGETVWSDYVGEKKLYSGLTINAPFYTIDPLNDYSSNIDFTTVAGGGAITKLIGRKGYSLTVNSYLNTNTLNSIGTGDYTCSFMMRLPADLYSQADAGAAVSPILKIGASSPGNGIWIVASNILVAGLGAGVYFYYHNSATKIAEYSRLLNGQPVIFTMVRQSGVTSFFIDGEKLSTTSSVVTDFQDKNIRIGYDQGRNKNNTMEILDFKLWNGTALTDMQVWHSVRNMQKAIRYDRPFILRDSDSVDTKYMDSFCAGFNGTSQALTIPHNAMFNFANGFDISFRASVSTTTQAGLIVVKADAGANYFAIWHAVTSGQAGNGIYIATGGGANGTTTGFFANDIATGLLPAWTANVMKNYRVQFSGRTPRLFVDDIEYLYVSNSDVGAGNIDVTNTADIKIAKARDPFGVYWAGSFCDLKISNGTTLISNHPLQGSLYDISGNGLNMTSVNVLPNLQALQNNFHRNIYEGCDVYSLDSAPTDRTKDVYVPYIAGTPVVASIAGYTKYRSCPAVTSGLNGCETKITFGAGSHDGTGYPCDALVILADKFSEIHDFNGYCKGVSYDRLVAGTTRNIIYATNTNGVLYPIVLNYSS